MIQSYPLPKRKEEFETLLCMYMDININQYTLWKFLLSANELLPQFIKKEHLQYVIDQRGSYY